MKLRVLSYNIHKGFDMSGKRLTLEEIREAIRSVDADLVFLQEVVGEHTEHSKNFEGWPERAQYEYLADSIWSYYSYAKNAVYEHGHHGNVILSKYPIVKWSQENISTNRFEQRGLLCCEIEIPGEELQGEARRLHLICVHLNLMHKGRKRQYNWIRKRIKKEVDDEAPVILAGDFNDWNKKASSFMEMDLNLVSAHKSLYGAYAKTFPSQFPLLCLDRVYIRGVTPLNASSLNQGQWSRLSDHAALLVEVELE